MSKKSCHWEVTLEVREPGTSRTHSYECHIPDVYTPDKAENRALTIAAGEDLITHQIMETKQVWSDD